MARLNAFYLEPAKWREPYELDGPEAGHLLTVLRAKPGDQVRLMDGAGRTGIFTLEMKQGKKARLSLLSEEVAEPPAARLHLALGWNKSGRRDDFLEKAVELGVWKVHFWQATRSQGRVPAEPKDAWTARCAQAAKQCGNPWLPGFETHASGSLALAALGQEFDHRLLLWEQPVENTGHPSGHPNGHPGEQPDQDFPIIDPPAGLDPATLGEAGSCLAVVGPEGGLETGEARTFLDAGFTPIHLGHHILRWETAALVLAGVAHLARENVLPGA